MYPLDIQSIMSGIFNNNVKIQYFKTENTLNEKKIVFTSGSGGIFKSGIPIGEINSGEEIKTTKVRRRRK